MNEYHKRFLSSRSSENVIALFSRYKGAAKEITESWSMLETAKKYFPNLSEYIVIIIGDGCSPRTGALFSYYTKAEVISVDPQLNLSHWQEHVNKQTAMGLPPQRISVIKEKIEDITIDCKNRKCLAIWPHSHADMNKLCIVNTQGRVDIALPCCVPIPIELKEKPHIMFKDANIESDKREIFVWFG